jgi:hypothetical protein
MIQLLTYILNEFPGYYVRRVDSQRFDKVRPRLPDENRVGWLHGLGRRSGSGDIATTRYALRAIDLGRLAIADMGSGFQSKRGGRVLGEVGRRLGKVEAQ